MFVNNFLMLNKYSYWIVNTSKKIHSKSLSFFMYFVVLSVSLGCLRLPCRGTMFGNPWCRRQIESKMPVVLTGHSAVDQHLDHFCVLVWSLLSASPTSQFIFFCSHLTREIVLVNVTVLCKEQSADCYRVSATEAYQSTCFEVCWVSPRCFPDVFMWVSLHHAL